MQFANYNRARIQTHFGRELHIYTFNFIELNRLTQHIYSNNIAKYLFIYSIVVARTRSAVSFFFLFICSLASLLMNRNTKNMRETLCG